MKKYTLENILKAIVASKGLSGGLCMVEGIDNPVSVLQRVNDEVMIVENNPLIGVIPHFRHKDTIATILLPQMTIDLPDGRVWTMTPRDPGDYLPPSAGCAG